MPRYWALIAVIILLKIAGIATAISSIIAFIHFARTPVAISPDASEVWGFILFIGLCIGLMSGVGLFARAQFLTLMLNIEKNTYGTYFLLSGRMNKRKETPNYAPEAPTIPLPRKRPVSVVEYDSELASVSMRKQR